MTIRAHTAENQLSQRASSAPSSREMALESQVRELQAALSKMSNLRVIIKNAFLFNFLYFKTEAESRAASAEIEAMEYSSQLNVARNKILQIELESARMVTLSK